MQRGTQCWNWWVVLNRKYRPERINRELDAVLRRSRGNAMVAMVSQCRETPMPEEQSGDASELIVLSFDTADFIIEVRCPWHRM